MRTDSTLCTDVRRRELLIAAAATTGASMFPLCSLAASPINVTSREPKLDLERFVVECIAANGDQNPQAAVLEVLSRTISNPNAVLAALGEPTKAGINVLHRSKTLTIFNATWTPQMNLMPHNHLMWANIGIYTGREDNILWRQTPDRIDAFSAKSLFAGDAAALPIDVIHSVTNPLPRFTGGIHIYGGDFFDTTRSQWNPETLQREPSDGASIRRMFELENERMRARRDS